LEKAKKFGKSTEVALQVTQNKNILNLNVADALPFWYSGNCQQSPSTYSAIIFERNI